MATETKIKIKYDATALAPVQLDEGELGFANGSEKLFIGTDRGDNIKEISGSGGTDLDFAGDNLVDYISDLELYRGEAEVGSLTSASVWRIRHIVINIDATSSTTTWASGTEAFDKIWDNRLLYVYS